MHGYAAAPSDARVELGRRCIASTLHVHDDSILRQKLGEQQGVVAILVFAHKFEFHYQKEGGA
jgi:hypothetical protein